jgi:hypothetical protein
VGCKSEENGPVSNSTSQLEEGIAGYSALKYEFLGSAPIHTQTSMLAGYQNKLYRYGSMWPIQVLDVSTKSWSQVILPDSTYWRWDGAAVTIGDSIFIIATYNNVSYDIIVFYPTTGILKHSNVNLPTGFSYPAYCVYQNKIIFLTSQTDSVLMFDATNRTLRTITSNPFYGSDSYYDPSLSSAKDGSFLYVFRNKSSHKNIFYRLNLDTYTWEHLDLPPVISQRYLLGASCSNRFVLFCDSVSTYQYLFVENKWYKDTSKIPLFPFYPQLNVGEWSYFAEDSCLYGTEVWSNMVWKISK